MREQNYQITENLKQTYQLIVAKFDSISNLDVIAISIPKLSAPFQFHFHDLLKEYHMEQDKLDECFHDLMFNAKSGRIPMGLVNFGTSELKKMVETEPKYRAIQNNLNTIQEEMKIVEEMLGTIKQFSFNISNAIKYRDLVSGAR